MKGANAIDYQQLDTALAGAGACTDAADSHGFLCGLICAAGTAEPAVWERELLGEQPAPGAALDLSRQLLVGLYEGAQVQLHSDDLDFELLLPDDVESLNLRADRLGQWCQGFLTGLALGGLSDVAGLPDDVNELLEDFSEISHAKFELDEGGDEDEAAFAEIVEYVRMGVLVIIGELQPVSVSTPLH